MEKTVKILLVDDEIKFLDVIANRLTMKGFDVTTADNGDAAIEAAKEGGFDVAVVDLQMPGTSGEKVLKVLKENHKFIEIIILTGHATVDSAVECTRLGAFMYVEKPYDFDKLVEALMQAYKNRMQRKHERDEQRMAAIQKIAIQQSPLGLMKALAKLDDDQK